MNRWYVGFLSVLIVGCGEKSNSDAGFNGVEELDANGDAAPVHQFSGGDLETMKRSPLFHEFNVDFFSSDPIQRVDTLTISSADTYKISLKTLNFLMEQQRFPLIQADRIVNKGLPTVIAPIGYKVDLEVVGNQIVAIIKSTTSPSMNERSVPFNTGNNDIIVGDLSAINLLLSGLHKDLSQSAIMRGALSHHSTALNQYVAYRQDQWFVQWSKRQLGFDSNVSAQLGKLWNVPHGNVQLSVQKIYRLRDRKDVNAASFKYSLVSKGSEFQGHLAISTLLNSPFQSAFGVGGQLRLCNESQLSFGVVISTIGMNVSIDYGMVF